LSISAKTYGGRLSIRRKSMPGRYPVKCALVLVRPLPYPECSMAAAGAISKSILFILALVDVR
jgi:hypothetical protein